jgi:hypothetical protein
LESEGKTGSGCRDGMDQDELAVEKKADGRSATERRLMMPAGCREYMRKTLAKEFPEIVKGFVDAAKTGSCPHVKLVTELMRPARQSVPRQRKGPAARFLEKLEKEKAEKERMDREKSGEPN